jgi:hypothetical protein
VRCSYSEWFSTRTPTSLKSNRFRSGGGFGLSPYIACALLLGLLKRPHAAAGALLVPAIMDAGNYYSVFIYPTSSTAGLGMIFVPLWNLAVFVPLGGALGWWIGRRISLTAADMPSNKSLERTHEG